MQDIRFDGIGSFAAGEYGRVQINGVCNCKGDLKAEYIDIDGIAKFASNIEAGEVEIDGTLKCDGTLKAGHLSCDGIAEFTKNVEAEQMKIDGVFSVKGNQLDARRIECDGVLNVDGQISADIIHIDGIIKAKEIVGDTIEIDSHPGNVFINLFQKRFSHIELIEATTVRLSGVKAQTVNGQNVVVGPNCEIQNLDCSGTLEIDSSSLVEHITGAATRR